MMMYKCRGESFVEGRKEEREENWNGEEENNPCPDS